MTYDFDPTIEKLQWFDENHIAFSTPKNGYTGVFSLNIQGNIEPILKPFWVIYDFQVIDSQILFTASRGSITKQLYKLPVGKEAENAEVLTNLNAALSQKIKTTSSLLNYKSKDGTKVQGIVSYPLDYKKSEMYPLMVIPHGGPDAVVMDDFNWMGQFFADNGYVVFQPNYRGSTGYGRDFYAGNRNAFGLVDFDDEAI